MRLALALTVLTLMVPALAQSQDYARPGFYLGAGGTYAFHWFPGDFDEDLSGGPTVRSSDSGGFNLQGGYRVNSWFGAELEYEWMEGFGNRTDLDGNIAKLRSHLVTVNGKFLYSGWGRWQPYGLLGVGVSIWEAKKTIARCFGFSTLARSLRARTTSICASDLANSPWLANCSSDLI